jgi:uncharacterized membrane protein
VKPRARMQFSRLAVRGISGTFLQQRSSVAHRAFLAAIAVKGLDGALELALGAIVAIVGVQRLYSILISITAPEIASDPDNHTVQFVRHSANGLAHASTLFVIVYLFAHGALKLGIAINLMRDKSWIFPIATAVLAGFILFMGYRLTLHWSTWLFALASFDVMTLGLVLNEWRSPRTAHAAHGPLTSNRI